MSYKRTGSSLPVCKVRPEMNFKEAIGRYEFSVVPRSMFAADGTNLHCSMKSKLMAILEDPSPQTNMFITEAEEYDTMVHMKVLRVDAVAEVQAISKPEDIENCSQLAHHFTRHIFAAV